MPCCVWPLLSPACVVGPLPQCSNSTRILALTFSSFEVAIAIQEHGQMAWQELWFDVHGPACFLRRVHTVLVLVCSPYPPVTPELCTLQWMLRYRRVVDCLNALRRWLVCICWLCYWLWCLALKAEAHFMYLPFSNFIEAGAIAQLVLGALLRRDIHT